MQPQEFPKLEKVANWNCDVKPDPIDWAKLLDEVEKRGEAVSL